MDREASNMITRDTDTQKVCGYTVHSKTFQLSLHSWKKGHQTGDNNNFFSNYYGKTNGHGFNPLSRNIRLHILLTVLHKFLMENLGEFDQSSTPFKTGDHFLYCQDPSI